MHNFCCPHSEKVNLPKKVLTRRNPRCLMAGTKACVIVAETSASACADCSAGPASSAPTPAASARAASSTTSSAAFFPVCQSSCWGRTPGRSTGLRAETWRTWWVWTLHKSSPTEGDRAVFRWCRGAAPAAPLCRRLSRFRSRRERSPPGKWSAPKKQNDRNDLSFG